MGATQDLVVFAERYGIKDPKVAAALPTVFAVAAENTGVYVRTLISRATYCAPLAEYLIEVAREAATEL